MLRRTSKIVKEVVDKMRLPAVVRLSGLFWHDARNGTTAQKLKFVMRQLMVVSARCCITTLKVSQWTMKPQVAKRLAGVLAQCPALTHLDLRGTQICEKGAEILAGVLGKCTALAH